MDKIDSKNSANNLTENEALLAIILDTLGLLVEQSRAYARVLPPDNHQAQLVVSTLGELARQAFNEAEDLELSLKGEQPGDGHPFTSREYEVLSLAAVGLTNKEIAYRLGISDRTVQFHMNAIFNKTDTSSRVEAVTFALARRWLTLDK